MIGNQIMVLIALLIGYTLGKYEKDPEGVINLQESINKRMRKLKRKVKGVKVGAVKKTTPEQQYINSIPVLKEEEEEMERVLDGKIPSM